MTEQQYQTKLIKKYEDLGYYVIKLMRTNKVGIPDLLCLKHNETPIFIEVKSINGKLSPIQKFRILELNKLGFNAIELKSIT